METIETIAFLGLGVMGAPIAENLHRAGFQVKAWNRHPDRPTLDTLRSAGVTLTDSLGGAVTGAQVVCTCVGDENDVAAVLLGPQGAAAHLRPGAWVIDFSTIGPQAARQIAKQLAPQGIGFLDAPVSGGDVGARNGTLTIMVGGDPQGFALVLPLLQAVGRTIRHCGPVGSGQAVKLCNQVLCASQMMGLCEAIALAQSQDLDPQLMIEICQTGAAGSWALSHLGPKIVTQDYAPGFMAAHLLKDLRLVMETWGDPQTLPGTRLAQTQFQRLGDRHQGTQALAQVYGLTGEGGTKGFPQEAAQAVNKD